MRIKALVIGTLLLVASPAFASGPPTYSGLANFAKEVGGEVYCAGGNTACNTFMSDAVTYLNANPGATITVTGVSDACYNVTGATFTGPSGDLGLNIAGYNSCSSDHLSQSVVLTVNAPPPPPPPPPSGNTGTSTAWMPQSSQLMAAVVTSVQETGGTIWQILGYLGIPIAFIIAYWVVELIRLMNRRKKTGYFKMRGPGDNRLVRYDDQNLGREMYDLQERGMTEL